MHVTLHILSLLIVIQCVTVINITVLQVRRLEQNTALNAKTEQFITAKISGNALTQGNTTNSMVCQCSLHSDTGP